MWLATTAGSFSVVVDAQAGDGGRSVTCGLRDWRRLSDEALYPSVQVDIRDLIHGREPWKLINRCAFAAKRAGLSAVTIMKFKHVAVHFCLTYADVFVLCLLWFDCESAVINSVQRPG
jgi:hypothetical protein